MIQFLEDLKGMGKKPLNAAELEELENLRKEHGRLRLKSQKLKLAQESDKSSDSEDEKKSEENDSSDEVRTLV